MFVEDVCSLGVSGRRRVWRVTEVGNKLGTGGGRGHALGLTGNCEKTHSGRCEITGRSMVETLTDSCTKEGRGGHRFERL